MAKLVVSEATLREAVAFGNGDPKQYIATGPSWPNWTIYADTVGRELVVTPPIGKRFRIPFEGVKWYIAGVVAPRELTAESLAMVE